MSIIIRILIFKISCPAFNADSHGMLTLCLTLSADCRHAHAVCFCKGTYGSCVCHLIAPVSGIANCFCLITYCDIILRVIYIASRTDCHTVRA